MEVRGSSPHEPYPSEALERKLSTRLKKPVRGNYRNSRKLPCSRFAPGIWSTAESPHQSMEPTMSDRSSQIPVAAPIVYLSVAPWTATSFCGNICEKVDA